MTEMNKTETAKQMRDEQRDRLMSILDKPRGATVNQVVSHCVIKLLDRIESLETKIEALERSK